MACPETGGAGCALGALGLVSAADHIDTGASNFGFPRSQQRQTTTVETLKNWGISENNAVLIQSGIDMGGNLAGSARQVAIVNSKVYYTAPPAAYSLESAGANYNYTFGKNISRMDSQTWGVADVTIPHATYNANELTQGMRTTVSQGNNVNIPRLTNKFSKASYTTDSTYTIKATFDKTTKDLLMDKNSNPSIIYRDLLGGGRSYTRNNVEYIHNNISLEPLINVPYRSLDVDLIRPQLARYIKGCRIDGITIAVARVEHDNEIVH